MTTLPQKIVRGDLRFQTTNPTVDGGLILGERLAERLRDPVGDVVTLIPPTPPR